MVGWSGSGRLDDLERTALRKLKAAKGDARRVGGALIVEADDPVAMARSLAHFPGVAWIAVGYRFSGTEGYLRNLLDLGRRYVTKGTSFKISAQSADSKMSAGDLVLAGNSELLASIQRSKVDERRPGVRFRVCVEGSKGACGAEILAGPGGVATRADWVSCLVSGGEHSSSMTWMAALSGYSIRLVHSMTDEAALRHVSRLYSELSHRMDSSCIELVLLKGEGLPLGRVGSWLRDHGGTAFAGLRPEIPDVLARFAARFPNLAFPLFLLQDDVVMTTFRSLELGRPAAGGRGSGLTLEALEAGGRYSEARFGGVTADSNTVIDTLKGGPISARGRSG